MNSTNIRRTAATFATATAAVLALGIVSPSPADATLRAPDGGSGTVSMDIDEVVTMLKVQRVQYLIGHPRLLR